MRLRTTWTALAIACIALVLFACRNLESPARSYVEADRATFEFLAPILRDVLEREPTLEGVPDRRLQALATPLARDNVADVLATWDLRIRAQEKTHGLLTGAR